ncbi:uncharacterized protein LOC101239361 isoform X3 [Hydra vulgaris]|uniref:uncharacterized protein LOC101239361 isoform X3 n=1 Tax=Hydra vulgaris TaxID=6087 RepID=UPI0032E9E187
MSGNIQTRESIKLIFRFKMNSIMQVLFKRACIHLIQLSHIRVQSSLQGKKYLTSVHLEDIVESLSSETSAGFQQKLIDLDNHNKYWPFELTGQKSLASLVHKLYCENRHSDISLISGKLNSINYDIWGGLATTILYSAIDQKKWKETFLLFESMRDKGQLKHVRLYKRLIVELVEDDKVSDALKYFNELSGLESHLTRLKSSDVLMLISMIKAAFRNKTQISVLLIESLLVYLETKDGRLLYGVILELLQYFRSSVNHLVKQAEFSNNTCLNCSCKLVDKPNYEVVCNTIINSIERTNDLDLIDEMIETKNGFHIIIDSGNVLFHGKGKIQRILSNSSLKHILLDVKKKFDKVDILLVFPTNYSGYDDLSYFQELSSKVSCFVPKITHDDQLILYAAAKSELKKKLVCMVSNDNFTDHTYLAASFINNWIRFLHDKLNPFNLNGSLEDKTLMPPVILSVLTTVV